MGAVGTIVKFWTAVKLGDFSADESGLTRGKRNLRVNSRVGYCRLAESVDFAVSWKVAFVLAKVTSVTVIAR